MEIRDFILGLGVGALATNLIMTPGYNHPEKAIRDSSHYVSIPASSAITYEGCPVTKIKAIAEKGETDVNLNISIDETIDGCRDISEKTLNVPIANVIRFVDGGSSLLLSSKYTGLKMEGEPAYISDLHEGDSSDTSMCISRFDDPQGFCF